MKLQIERVSKTYRGKVVLDEFEAELTEGVHALLGPNGAGKSTIMRIIAGVLKPSAGRVLVDGEDIVSLGESYREILGYLPQTFGVYKNFTAERFLLYISALKGLPKAIAPSKVTEMLQLVNLEHARHIKVGKFSGGMKQRLGIAQALLNDPKILIVDEPTAGLDPKERVRFRSLLSQFAADRIVVLSTHIIADVEFVARNILLVNSGRLVAQNTPEGFLSELEGKVWTLCRKETEVSNVRQHFQVSHMVHTSRGIEMRILSNSQPTRDALVVPATLEDLYMYYFNEEAITDAAAIAYPI